MEKEIQISHEYQPQVTTQKDVQSRKKTIPFNSNVEENKQRAETEKDGRKI